MGSSGRVRGLNLATYTRSGPGFAVVEHTQSAGGCRAPLRTSCDVGFEKGFGSLRRIPEPIYQATDVGLSFYFAGRNKFNISLMMSVGIQRKIPVNC